MGVVVQQQAGGSSRPPTLATNPPTKMLALVTLSALLVVSSAAPGGYTGLGGLYKNMNQNADYMPHAKNATQIAFEEDESLVGGQAVRPARRASVYVPTFFTSEPQPNVADASLPQLQRINRQTQQVELPLYYNAYRAPNKQVVYQ